MDSDTIEIRTEQRPDGWAVVVIDKYATHEQTGLTESEAEAKAMKMLELVHEIFNIKEQA